MNNFRTLIALGYHYLVYLRKVMRILKKGQSEVYEIMMIAHRLEKGLIKKNPKPNWGWDKAERLCYLLSRNENSISYQTGLSVLNKYLDSKYDSVEKERGKKLKKKYGLDNSQIPGGVLFVPNPTPTATEAEIFSKIVQTRHSVRNFDSKELDYEKVYNAINLALHSPSACNRQPYKVYIVSDEVRRTFIEEDVSAASIYVTGVIDAFNAYEMLDWIVSPSIFVGYLTLSLHINGIGSCVYRKDLICETEYNKKVKEICRIPDNEQIILELRIGTYPDTVYAATSNRFLYNDITKIF